MQTQIPAQQAKQNQSQLDHKTTQLQQPQFEDARADAATQLRQQSLMAGSSQVKQLQSIQAMMAASTRSQHAHSPLLNSPAVNPPVQRLEEDEPLQRQPDVIVQREQTETPAETPPPKPNNTGLPDNLKAGIENLSGISMDHVRVHYNSDKPAQLQAHAYAQGSEIHVAPGQEKHLPHEAWHVVQQAQGRVRPTVQMKGGVGVNDDEGLEGEADLMGAKALQKRSAVSSVTPSSLCVEVIQRRMGVEAELSIPVTLANPVAVTADDRIRAFLGGGVWYDTPLEPVANGVRKSADHGPLGTVIENARAQMDAQAQANLRPPIPQLNGPTKPAIMEFVTDPYDVSTHAGRVAFRNDITQMAADIGAVYANAIAGTTPTTLSNCIYGVPPLADWQAFAVANHMGIATGTAIHTNIIQQMNDQLYVQMTMGVQLRRMRKFLNKVNQNNHLASQATSGDPHHAALVTLVTSHAAADAAIVLSNTFGFLDVHNRRGSDSLRGYTALLLSYLYGSYVYQTVDIAKNMVAALSKTPLHIVQQEITLNKRPDQWTVAERANYQTAIFNRLVARLSQAPYQSYWVAGNHGAGLLGNWQLGWLPNVLNGAADSFAGDAANPGNLILGGAAGDDHTIAPEDDVNSKAIVGGPGRPAARSAPNQELSGVIPTELRFIEERPTPNQLLTLVNRGISLVNSVN